MKIHCASTQELVNTQKTILFLDGLIFPRCFNNVCNMEYNIVNKEYQSKVSVSERICKRRYHDDEI